jgi:hypothetical protein
MLLKEARVEEVIDSRRGKEMGMEGWVEEEE